MSFRLRFVGLDFGTAYRTAVAKDLSQMSLAIKQTTVEVAKAIERNGRRDIAAAGRFGRKWTQGLHVEVTPRSGALTNSIITVSHDIPFATVFETGKLIRGKPLLWVPLSFARVRKGEPLFRVDRKGKAPLLLALSDKKPKFVGLKRVNIRKRFHLRRIMLEQFRRIPQLYLSKMR